jgi:heme-degrading monooxygenase HmoA
MPFVSVTRLQLRSLLYLPMFIPYSLASIRQARRAPGFLSGWTGYEPLRGFWTVTVWDSLASMHAFRNSGAHRRAMPRLLDWCDEAAYTHWQQEDARLPGAEEARATLVRDGRPSKVHRPSPRQVAGEPWGSRPPRAGSVMTPLAG